MLQDTIVAMALEKVGLCYGDPSKRPAYRDFIYAFDGPDADDFASKMMSCLMLAKALMAHNEVNGVITYRGARRDVLRESYANFLTQIDLIMVGLAKENKLLVRNEDVSAEMLRAAIEPGCLVVHGAGGQLPKEEKARQAHLALWGGVAHGLVATMIEGDTVLSVDGGQLDPLNQNRCTAVLARERDFSIRKGKLWLGDRRVNYVFPMHKMPVVSR